MIGIDLHVVYTRYPRGRIFIISLFARDVPYKDREDKILK